MKPVEHDFNSLCFSHQPLSTSRDPLPSPGPRLPPPQNTADDRDPKCAEVNQSRGHSSLFPDNKESTRGNSLTLRTPSLSLSGWWWESSRKPESGAPRP